MNSMTGFGCGECSRDGVKVTVELSSVNRRQIEIGINLPRELEVLEAQIREEVNKQINRGRVNIRVSLHAVEGRETARIHLNKPMARAYARELARLARELKLEGGLTLDSLLRAPGVLQGNGELAEAEDLWPAVRKALKQGLVMLMAMRAREGQCLRKDISGRVAIMRKSAARISRRAPQVLQRYREQLLERARNAGLDPAQIDEERLYKELVLFADRSDVSEELARLESHFQQFDAYLNSSDAVGRTLDFLAQEMNREINTIGSKANDSAIAHEVVVLKTELEKFREQAQNVE
jgi:uncharacterized protein (TIGR00255 family)